jgi:hypothetical protein
MRVVTMVLGRRVEHRQEALDHQFVELGLDLAQGLRRLQRRDDGEVVADLGVVEHALGRLDVVLCERRGGVPRLSSTAGQVSLQSSRRSRFTTAR